MDSYIQNHADLMVQIQTAVLALYKNTSSPTEETETLVHKLKTMTMDNLGILQDLRMRSKEMRDDAIQMQCDKEQLTLELETAEEQLTLHRQHSGNDQDMLLKMMAQIERLKQDNCELSERLTHEMENNQRRLVQLNRDIDGNHRDIIQGRGTEKLMGTIEKYHCKLLSLEAVIESLRRKGVHIPEFPIITRAQKAVQADDFWVRQDKRSEQEEKAVEIPMHKERSKNAEKMSELYKEIKYLKTQNDIKTDNFRNSQETAQALQRRLSAQQAKFNKIELINLSLKQEMSDERERASKSARSRVFKLGFCIMFAVGMVYRKRKRIPCFHKRIL